MEEAVAILALVVLSAVISGTASCSYGESAVRREAVKEGVACYQADSEGRAKFFWHCKQPTTTDQRSAR